MKGLVLKILRGSYPAIPSNYSKDLKELIADMLIKDPLKRPSMRKILEKEFLSKRISKLLTKTIAKNEFSSTFLNKHIAPHQNSQEENKINDAENSSNIEIQEPKQSDKIHQIKEIDQNKRFGNYFKSS
jgi:NIMA (never in mitosis gene a)-related kinase